MRFCLRLRKNQCELQSRAPRRRIRTRSGELSESVSEEFRLGMSMPGVDLMEERGFRVSSMS